LYTFCCVILVKAEHINQRRPEILRMAINRNKDNVDVWVEVLKYHTGFVNNYKLAKQIFDDGVRALENKSLLLWEIMNLYLYNNFFFQVWYNNWYLV
jgi:hypothetical protein